MSRVQLALACGSYDRTIPLEDGTVQPEGVDLNFISMQPGELFQRQARRADFDVSELSLSTYCTLKSQNDSRFVAIPVFPSRMFRHSYIFVNTSKASEAADLSSQSVGTPDYQQTAGVWIRGVLKDEYSVDLDSIRWMVGAMDEPASTEARLPLSLPERVSVARIDSSKSLDQMLVNGELAAVMGPHPPRSFYNRLQDVRRLFDNSMGVEQDYYKRTRIFPIMHLIVIKRDVYDSYPWVAESLYNAFCTAKAMGESRLRFTGTLYSSLPWLMKHLEDLAEFVGSGDLFGYGLDANRHVLNTFLGYCLNQGLLARPVELKELFVFDG